MARKNPGRVSNLNARGGSTNHPGCALFSQAMGVRMNENPYRGEGPARNDIVAGLVRGEVDRWMTVIRAAGNASQQVYGCSWRRSSVSFPQIGR